MTTDTIIYQSSRKNNQNSDASLITEITETKNNWWQSNNISSRQAFGEELTRLARRHPEVTAAVVDCRESLYLEKMSQILPEQFVELGVAEQNLAGVAAGLAMAGNKVFAAGFAAFNPGRNWEQIRVSIVEQNLPVIVVGSHAGLATGPDGATHQALEDLALTRVLPRMRVIVPADAAQTIKVLQALVEEKQTIPTYLRLTREASPPVTNNYSDFAIGQAQELRSGDDITLIASGLTVALAFGVAQELEKKHGFQARVINLHTLKPLDTIAIDQAAHQTRVIVTIEDHQIIGGLGGAVAEFLATLSHHAPLVTIGVKDSFGETGTWQELWDKHGLSVSHICQEITTKLN